MLKEYLANIGDVSFTIMMNDVSVNDNSQAP